MEYEGFAFCASELVRNGQGNSPESGSPIREASNNACLPVNSSAGFLEDFALGVYAHVRSLV
ncbi:exosome component 10-like [Pyrus ussuriensis x Pyrus communis]|uniref:Exosome component 10-like n=1 Tax=Pyrus ussuriensis x Pyrus communis TaxID=2448454 RepID=A0A5N5HD54_9ROSA|nr:exosome component 10-like [Pyrus ussuriensis x Pyrus communis]